MEGGRERQEEEGTTVLIFVDFTANQKDTGSRNFKA